MKIAVFTITILLPLFVFGQTKKAAIETTTTRNEDVKEEIKRLEMERIEAATHGDTRFLELSTADDYTATNAFGQTSTKAQMLDDLRSGQVKLSPFSREDLNVRVYGDTAVVTGRSTVTVKGTDRLGIGDQLRFIQVFAKRNGRWQAVAFQQTLVKVKVVVESSPHSCPVTYRPVAGGANLDFGTTRAERHVDPKTYEFVCECAANSKPSKVVDCTEDTTVSFECKQ